MRRLSSLLILLCISALTAPALEWTGECVHVGDGDSITVMYHELPLKVRLYGIDAPERGQDFGRRATEHLAGMVHRKEVTVRFLSFDAYNRVLALVKVGETDVNREMIAAGFAWVFTKYCEEPQRGEWQLLEGEARQQRLGLWLHANPVSPWQWRKEKRAADKR